MIPFASQRRNGQDLATHLLNTYDNEHMELAEVRGAVARDLHGAFAEWEAQAAALTRCRNYLYSLSINPDPSHGQLSRQQYLAYIDQVEEQLGLSGQPRAVVFHVKEGREHCHVVWSRIDVPAGKARHLAYDHDKLMMATRQFAADHGIKLPKGYYNDEPGHQLSLYEKVQQDQTGLSLEERKAVITGLWRRSDSATAFVSALAESGYILATGKRPFLLVDVYGHVNALPKLIDDREVRTNDLREFLGVAYEPEGLPSVEEAQVLAAQHRQALEDFEKARIGSGKEEELKQRQGRRRAELEKQVAALTARQRRQLQALDERHSAERRAAGAVYLAEVRRIRIERARRRPKGLAAFLGMVSGVALIRKKLQRYRDRKRYEAYRAARRELRDLQAAQRAALVLSHQLQALELERQIPALAQVEQRERQSLETTLMRERRERINERHAHMPPVSQALEEFGRQAEERAPEEVYGEADAVAKVRSGDLTGQQNEAANGDEDDALTNAFRQAVTEEENQTGETDSGGGMDPPPEGEQTPGKRRRKRPRRRRSKSERGPLSKAFELATDESREERDGGDGEAAGGALPESGAGHAWRMRGERKRDLEPDGDEPMRSRRRRRKGRKRDREKNQDIESGHIRGPPRSPKS